jgi:hypothetical protein
LTEGFLSLGALAGLIDAQRGAGTLLKTVVGESRRDAESSSVSSRSSRSSGFSGFESFGGDSDRDSDSDSDSDDSMALEIFLDQFENGGPASSLLDPDESLNRVIQVVEEEWQRMGHELPKRPRSAIRDKK